MIGGRQRAAERFARPVLLGGAAKDPDRLVEPAGEQFFDPLVRDPSLGRQFRPAGQEKAVDRRQEEQRANPVVQVRALPAKTVEGVLFGHQRVEGHALAQRRQGLMANLRTLRPDHVEQNHGVSGVGV